MKVINLTPHAITVVLADGKTKTFPSSGKVVRVNVTYDETALGDVIGVPTTMATFGKVEDLPPEEPDTYYIVSTMVAQALEGTRLDLLAPGELVRDKEGQPVGCKSLVSY
jgi:hypothetical protein